MASRKRSISRSVACSLAALLLLSGCMFMVSTFQSDSEEWVLVEDQVLGDYGVYSGTSSSVMVDDYLAEYEFTFDEDTSVYTYEVTGGSKASSTNKNFYYFSALEGFDFSKDYKFVFNSEIQPREIYFLNGADSWTQIVDFKSVSADDEGIYTAELVMLDQYVTDFSYKEAIMINCQAGSNSATYDANTFTIQLYELQTDNTGSIAAGITGLIMIVCGVFAMPMHNILRRR